MIADCTQEDVDRVFMVAQRLKVLLVKKRRHEILSALLVIFGVESGWQGIPLDELMPMVKGWIESGHELGTKFRKEKKV